MKKLLWFLLCVFSIQAEYEYTRHTLPRDASNKSEIIYYLSQSDQKEYPIVVLCEGSYCAGQQIKSPSGLLKNFLPILKDCNVGLLTVEKWGVNGTDIDKEEFHAHNTITQRIADHQQVVDYLMVKRPEGWNKKVIFLGGSEGGDIATALTLHNSKQTIATIIFAGIGLRSRQEEIWDHMQAYRQNAAWYEKLGLWFMGAWKDRQEFDEQVTLMKQNPNPKKWWYGQTYTYWADAFSRSREALLPEFYNLKSPIFISTGTADSFIASSDELVEKMKQHGMHITYHRLQDVPHGMTDHAPHIFNIAADWLQEVLVEQEK